MKKILSLVSLFFVLLSLAFCCGCDQIEDTNEEIKNAAYIDIQQKDEAFLIKEKIIYNMAVDKNEIKFLLPQNVGREIKSEKEKVLGVEIISVRQNEKYLPFNILNDSQNILNVQIDSKNENNIIELELDYRLKFKKADYLYFLSVLPCLKQENLDFAYSEYEPLVFNEPFDIYFNFLNSEFYFPFEKENNLFKIENTVDFCLLKTKSYKKQELKLGDKTIEYYYKNDTAPSETLTFIKDAFLFLNDNLYNFPQNVLSVMEGDKNDSFSNAVIVDTNQTRESYKDNLFRLLSSIWFKKILLIDSVNEPYFYGGLVEYSLASFLSERGADFDKMADSYKNNLANFESNAIKMNYPFKLYNTRKASEYLNDYDYMYNVYAKSFLSFYEKYNNENYKVVIKKLNNYFLNNAFKKQDYNSFLQQI